MSSTDLKTLAATETLPFPLEIDGILTPSASAQTTQPLPTPQSPADPATWLRSSGLHGYTPAGPPGHFRILERLGAGSMGVVYRAYDPRLHRTVALKLLRPSSPLGPGDAAGGRRFVREARLLASFDHPHLLKVYEAGHLGGRPYMVMELVEGTTLREVAGAEPALPRRELLRLTLQVVRALAFIHQRGVVHRDIKPGNILLRHRHGRYEAVLADFGVAGWLEARPDRDDPTLPGFLLGTPAYLAPEQAAGEPVDQRADLYGVGALLYELLTGEPPFGRGGAAEVLRRCLTEELRPPRALREDISPGLEHIVLTCLERDPSRRYPRAEDLAADLAAHLASPGGSRVRSSSPATQPLQHPEESPFLCLDGSAPRSGTAVAKAAPSSTVGSRHHGPWLWLALLLTLLFAALPALTQEPDGAEQPDAAPGSLPERPSASTLEITPGLPRELSLHGGESHFFRFSARRGDLLFPQAAQHGLDVGLILLSPDGSLLAEVNRPTGSEGRESLPAVAQQNGLHELEVRALGPGEEGGYLLELPPPLPASAEQAALAELHRRAWRALDEGQDVRARARSAEVLEQAVATLTEAAGLWARLGDRDQEGAAYNTLGVAQRQLGRSQDAATSYERALALWRRAGNRRGEADALHNLGRVRQVLGEVGAALEAHTGALALRRELGRREDEAKSLTQIASVHRALGQISEATLALDQALAVLAELGDTRALANAYNLAGILSREAGDEQEALESFRQALAGWQGAEDLQGQAATLNNLGNAYRALGDHERARDLYLRTLAICQQMGDRDGEAYAHYHLGWTARSEDNAEAARTAFEGALELWREVGNRREEGMALAALGDTLVAEGQAERAIRHLEAAHEVAIETADRRGTFFALYYLGKGLRELERWGESGAHLTRALATADEMGNVASSAMVLTELARLDIAQGELEPARERLRRAVEITEGLRGRIASEELQVTYLAASIERYDLLVRVLMQLDRGDPGRGHAQEALAVAERSRARSLLDSLARASAGAPDSALPPELVEIEEMLRREISARERRRLGLLAEAESSAGTESRANEDMMRGGGADDSATPATAEQRGEESEITALDREITRLLARLADVREEMRRRSDHYASFVHPDPIPPEQIQRELLDEGTMLLTYHLGEHASYLWAMTPSSLESFELPPRGDLERHARDFYRYLRTPGDLPPDLTAIERQGRLTRASTSAIFVGVTLSELLLGPIRDQLHTASASTGQIRRLVIVADGALQALPFGVLPLPLGGARAGERLVRRMEVSYLPSASVLRWLRRPTQCPQRLDSSSGSSSAARTLAVLADPVFSPADPRVEHADGAAAGAGLPTSLHLPRLRFSRGEALALAELVPEEERLLALGFAADRERFVGGELSTYRLLHLATHGVLDDRNPSLSAIVLSLVDEAGRPREGFLRLQDVYPLRLDAELVSLSACQTALGKDRPGEGFQGLARGFLHAGARRVVGGLWRVPDKATRELMVHFYSAMLQHGLSPAAALRQAQLALLDSGRWEKPYYWGAFVLQGEWRGAPCLTFPDKEECT